MENMHTYIHTHIHAIITAIVWLPSYWLNLCPKSESSHSIVILLCVTQIHSVSLWCSLKEHHSHFKGLIKHMNCQATILSVVVPLIWSRVQVIGVLWRVRVHPALLRNYTCLDTQEWALTMCHVRQVPYLLYYLSNPRIQIFCLSLLGRKAKSFNFLV